MHWGYWELVRRVGWSVHRRLWETVPRCESVVQTRAIVSDLHRIGDALWARFEKVPEPKPAKVVWYYLGLVSAFRENPASEPALVDELDRTVKEMARLAGVPRPAGS